MKKFILVLSIVMFGNALYADSGAEIKYRESVMEVVGGHMHSIGAILKGRVHMSDLNFHAQGMKRIATIVPHVFPAGSSEGKTEALASIWEKPVEFQAAVDKFVDAANGMALATEAGDMAAVGPAVRALGGSCKGCHDDFKAE